MTLREAFCATRAALVQAGIEDAAFDAAQLVQLAAGQDYRLAPDNRLTAAQQAALAALTARRAAHEPLQYLCGTWDFLDFTLAVGEGVLIPRADTECVCEEAIRAAQCTPAPTVVDLCSGSGAIAIGIARAVPDAAVTAVELSAQALPYLQRNVAALCPRVAVVQADVFAWQATLAPAGVDVVVSNPPYISAQEMQTLAPEVLREPRMALEAAENGLAFYRHIAAAYRPALKPGGALVLEIGSTQVEAVTALLEAAGYTKICVLPDAAGLPRCVRAQNGIYYY